MGSIKEYWFDQIEAQKVSRLADLLGITEDELEQIAYDIQSNESNDGLLYGYNIYFEDNNDPKIMSKINGLTSGKYVRLSPWDLEDPEQDELDWEVGYSDQLITFNRHLSSVSTLLQLKPNVEAQFSLLVMLHAHIVSALEQFLATTFIYRVTNSDCLTRKLIETDPEFGNRKFSINEIYAQHRDIKATVARYLKDINFHEMRKVKPMYADVLSYDFGDIAWLFKAVILRHDCAHRAGYDKEGKPVPVSAESIDSLMINCRSLAEAIDNHVRQMVNS